MGQVLHVRNQLITELGQYAKKNSVVAEAFVRASQGQLGTTPTRVEKMLDLHSKTNNTPYILKYTSLEKGPQEFKITLKELCSPRGTEEERKQELRSIFRTLAIQFVCWVFHNRG